MAREGDRSINDVKYEKLRPWTLKIDYDGGTNPIYMGKARAGTATSESYWQIRKFTWDGNDNPTDRKWADGVTTFTKEWDERGNYSYS